MVPAPDAHRVAVRAAITLLTALLVLAAFRRLDLGLAAALGTFPTGYGGRMPVPGRWRTQLALAGVLTAAVGLGTLVAISPDRVALSIPAAALAAGVGAWLTDRYRWSPPLAMFMVFAVGGCASIPADVSRLGLSVLVTAATGLLAVLLGRSEELVFGALLLPRWRPDRVVPQRMWVHVTRAGGAVVVAGLLATALAGAHPYWAMMAAVVPIAMPSIHGQIARGVQRTVGTAAGLGIAALLLSISLPPLAIVVIGAALQAVVELTIGRNYTLAMMAITPLALLLGQVALARPVGPLLAERLWETVIGVTVGVIATVLVRPWSLRRRTGERRRTGDPHHVGERHHVG